MPEKPEVLVTLDVCGLDEFEGLVQELTKSIQHINELIEQINSAHVELSLRSGGPRDQI